MERRSRRGFLAGLGVAAGLSGCLSAGSDGDGTTGASGSGTDASGRATLDSYEVGGSPGGPVAVRPEGRVVLLDFFATWCAPCKPQMAHLNEIRSEFPDVHMLSITWESDAEAVRSFWREYEGAWPVASDPEVRTGQRFGVDRLPTHVIFDREGTEQSRATGLVEARDIARELRAAGAEG